MWIVVCCGGSRLDQNPGCCEHQHEGQPSELISHDIPSRMYAGRGALPGPSLTPAGKVSRPSGAPKHSTIRTFWHFLTATGSLSLAGTPRSGATVIAVDRSSSPDRSEPQSAPPSGQLLQLVFGGRLGA